MSVCWKICSLVIQYSQSVYMCYKQFLHTIHCKSSSMYFWCKQHIELCSGAHWLCITQWNVVALESRRGVSSSVNWSILFLGGWNHTWYLSFFLHSHILSPGNFTLGKCVNLRQTEPKAVIFSFFWIFFTLSQKFYTHGVTDKYQVWQCQESGNHNNNFSGSQLC